jgi:tetratricopeptide (TPR) repeat protein
MLSSLIHDQEAQLFSTTLTSFRNVTSSLRQHVFDTLRLLILPDLRAVLGRATELRAAGSFAKGTVVKTSDIDCLIDTGDVVVTREMQHQVLDCLQKKPFFATTALGCLAIHTIFQNVDVDLVFSNLAQHDERPAMDQSIAANPDIAMAATALKLAISSERKVHIPGFLLELLAKEMFNRRSTGAATPSAGSVAMHVFLDCAQAIVDSSEGASILNSLQPGSRALSANTLLAANRHLAWCLHVFCTSRLCYAEGFSSSWQIQAWLIQAHDWPLGSPVGPVPPWLLRMQDNFGSKWNMYALPFPSAESLHPIHPTTLAPEQLTDARLRKYFVTILQENPLDSIPDTSKVARESGNFHFNNSDYTAAVEAYSICLQDYPSDFRALCNRSACYFKLNNFLDAARDADRAIRVQPRFMKAYYRSARAHVSLGNLEKALEVCRRGLHVDSNTDLVQLLEETLQQLPEGLQVIDPKTLECWKHVLFPDSLIVVASADCKSRGQFYSIESALDSMSYDHEPTTIIVMGPHEYTGAREISIHGTVQILGEKMPLIRSPQSNLFWVSHATLYLQELKMRAMQHCVFVHDGEMYVSNCEGTSIDVAVFGAGPRSITTLRNCNINSRNGRHPSDAALVVQGEQCTVFGYDCTFEGTIKNTVAVRAQASCTLEDCKITRSLAQGVCVNQARLVLERCEIQACGTPPSVSAVLLNCGGELTVLDCSINKNRCDGIVVQSHTPEAGMGHLVLLDSQICNNAGSGVLVYQGSAEISRSRICKNSVQGVYFGYVSPRKSSVTNCTVKGNQVDIILPKNFVSLADNLHGTPVMDSGILSHFTRQKMSMLSGLEELDIANFPMYGMHNPDPFDRANLLTRFKPQFMDSQSSQFRFHSSDLKKPQRTTENPNCRPTYLRQAWPEGPGTRSIGRKLVGKTYSFPSRLTSVMVLLEDAHHDAVFVALYNMPATLTYAALKQSFPFGARVTIFEPYFHKFHDGNVGIHVNDPSEVVVEAVCWQCDNAGQNGKLMQCSGCQTAVYCSKSCQKKGWLDHKTACKSLKQLCRETSQL